MPRLMSEKETAIILGMSVHWLRRKRWQGGGIPYVKMGKGGAVQYSEEIVQQFIQTPLKNQHQRCR